MNVQRVVSSLMEHIFLITFLHSVEGNKVAASFSKLAKYMYAPKWHFTYSTYYKNIETQHGVMMIQHSTYICKALSSPYKFRKLPLLPTLK